MEKVSKCYSNLISRILHSKKISIRILIISFSTLIILLLFIFPRIRSEIIADPKSNRISIQYTSTIADDKEQLFELFKPYEEKIVHILGNRALSRFSNVFNATRGNCIITLKNASYLDNAIEDIRDILENNAEWTFDIAPWDPSKLPLPRTYGLHIKIAGPDKKTILQLMEKIIDEVNRLDIYRNVYSVPSTRLTNEIMFEPRKEITSQFNKFTNSKISSMIRILLNGSKVITLNDGEDRININMNYPDDLNQSIEDILQTTKYHIMTSRSLRHFLDYQTKQGISKLETIMEETFNILPL